jgi:hypothetical protein
MDAYRLSVLPIAPAAPVQSARTRPGQPFNEILTQASAAVPEPAVDPQDEDAALRELFHLVSLLSLGVVDASLLKAEDRDPLAPVGPNRAQVESLKEAIRKLLRGAGADADVLDPVTGKPRPYGAGRRRTLKELIASLPEEFQNLLRKAFPDMDDLVAAELARRQGPRAG